MIFAIVIEVADLFTHNECFATWETMGQIYDVEFWESGWVPHNDGINVMWQIMEGEFDLRGIVCSKEQFQESLTGFSQAAIFYKDKIGFHRSYLMQFLSERSITGCSTLYKIS